MLFEEVAKTQPRDIDPDVDLLTTSQCIPADQLISTPAGLKYVGEIFTETGIGIAAASKKTPYSYPLLNREGDVENTSALTNNGSRPVHRITTRSGTDVKATANHPFLVVNESGWWVWRRAAEIRHGSRLLFMHR
jgi:intein/homing endonuclease